MSMSMKEKILGVLGRLATLKEVAESKCNSARSGSFPYQRGQLFALTIACREIESLLPRPKKQKKVGPK